MLLLILKPLWNINEGILGICCMYSGVNEFGTDWVCPQAEGICYYLGHSCNSGKKYGVAGMQKISSSGKISFSFKTHAAKGIMVWAFDLDP